MDNIEFSTKLLHVYHEMLKKTSQKYQLTLTELDIILFLANHPRYHSAKDIVKIRGIKANLVSMNVEKLTQKGYLIRKEVKGDRRSIQLILTAKTSEIICEGQRVQKEFLALLFKGISDEEKAEFMRLISIIHCNIESMRD